MKRKRKTKWYRIQVENTNGFKSGKGAAINGLMFTVRRVTKKYLYLEGWGFG